MALFASLSALGAVFTLANRHWRTQLGSLWLGLVLGLTLVSFALLVANLLALISGSGQEQAGYFFGVPIAHAAAGMLLVIGGTATAIHAQASNQNERMRDINVQYLQWVEALGNTSMRSVALRGIRQLIEDDERLIAPTWELARRSIVEYLTAPCLEPGCSPGEGVCRDHLSDQSSIGDSLSLLDFCQIALERHPMAAIKTTTAISLRNRHLVRSLDLTTLPGPPIRLDLGSALLTDGVELRLRSTQCASPAPVLAPKAQLHLVHSGAWTGRLLADAESTEAGLLHVRGEGTLMLEVEGDQAKVACRVVVDHGTALTLDLSRAVSPTVDLTGVEIGGRCQLLPAAEGGEVTLTEVRDHGGELHLGGEKPWRRTTVTVECVKDAECSEQFLQFDKVALEEGGLTLTNVMPREVDGRRRLRMHSLTLYKSTASLHLATVASSEAQVALSDARIEGDPQCQATLVINVDGNGTSTGVVTVECTALADAALTVNYPECAAATAVVRSTSATGAVLNLGCPTEKVPLASDWVYAVPDGVKVEVGDALVWRAAPELTAPAPDPAATQPELPAPARPEQPAASGPPDVFPTAPEASPVAPPIRGRRRESETG